MAVVPAGSVADAVRVLAQDGCVAVPTETVWGLAASAGSAAAVEGIRVWKGRADDQPISVLVSDASRLAGYGFAVAPQARTLIEAFWPGPLTLVLPCRSSFAPGVARADGGVGVRCSPHVGVTALVAAAEASGLGPLTATSCNRSGEPPAQTEAEARALCARVPGPFVLEAGENDAGGTEPSTVLDLVAAPARILREGGVSAAMLRPFLEMSQEMSAGDPPGSPEGERTG
ncbi:MAG: L-threonylcarbamoyladenylate synthase [Myxococcota bacterium]|nr:L-threonylcarbamoyladenylate synthase [Myxococcota bacterium]